MIKRHKVGSTLCANGKYPMCWWKVFFKEGLSGEVFLPDIALFHDAGVKCTSTNSTVPLFPHLPLHLSTPIPPHPSLHLSTPPTFRHVRVDKSFVFCSSSHLTSEYRATSKENRELTHRLEGLKEQRARSVCLLRSPGFIGEAWPGVPYFSFNRTVDNVAAASLTSPEAEAVKRRARITKVWGFPVWMAPTLWGTLALQVREMWRNVEEFELRTSRQVHTCAYHL